jgi:type VI secretion system secreted protein Hcp
MPVYMKYGKISGPVTGKYKGWIELNTCQFGVGRGIGRPVGSSSNQEASAPNVSEVVVTKAMDIASPLLYQEALIGEATKVLLEFVQSDKLKTVYLQVELEGAMVSSYSVSSGGDKPSESLSINFTKITYKTTVATTPPATVTGP